MPSKKGLRFEAASEDPRSEINIASQLQPDAVGYFEFSAFASVSQPHGAMALLPEAGFAALSCFGRMGFCIAGVIYGPY